MAVPLSNTKDFFKSYEKLCDWVVPRSAYFITKDSEYELYAVTTFKKSGQEFVHKARERKWVPRDYKFEENGSQKEKKELEKVQADEKRQWGETLRLGRTGWSDGVMCLVHVVILRVFVETVLRYGLPLDFVAALVKVSRPLIPLRGHLLTICRQPASKKSVCDKVSIRSTPTSPATPSARTRKGDPRKTTQMSMRDCKLQAREVTGRNIRLMSAMAWRLID